MTTFTTGDATSHTANHATSHEPAQPIEGPLPEGSGRSAAPAPRSTDASPAPQSVMDHATIAAFARGLQDLNHMAQSPACLALLDAWTKGSVDLPAAAALLEAAYQVRRDDPCRGGDLLNLHTACLLANPAPLADADLLRDYLPVLATLHGALFANLLPNDAFRLHAFTKTDPTGSGCTVTFVAPRQIGAALAELFDSATAQTLCDAQGAPDADAIASLIAGLYRVRPFDKGSLKVAAVYLLLLLERLGARPHGDWLGAHNKAYHRALYTACSNVGADPALLRAVVQGTIDGTTASVVVQAEKDMGLLH